MKKILTVLIAVVIIVLNTASVFAGDIPETILSDDAAQLYFGELVEVNVLSNDFKTVVKPVKKVKGDVSVGVESEYISPQFVGNFSAKKGNVYLFAYINESNPLYIFEVDSYDTTTIKVTGAKDEETAKNKWYEPYYNDKTNRNLSLLVARYKNREFPHSVPQIYT